MKDNLEKDKKATTAKTQGAQDAHANKEPENKMVGESITDLFS